MRPRRPGYRHRHRQRRRGAILLLVAAGLVSFMLFASFAVDVGTMHLDQERIEAQVRAAAQAGYAELRRHGFEYRTHQQEIDDAARRYLRRNGASEAEAAAATIVVGARGKVTVSMAAASPFFFGAIAGHRAVVLRASYGKATNAIVPFGIPTTYQDPDQDGIANWEAESERIVTGPEPWGYVPGKPYILKFSGESDGDGAVAVRKNYVYVPMDDLQHTLTLEGSPFTLPAQDSEGGLSSPGGSYAERRVGPFSDNGLIRGYGIAYDALAMPGISQNPVYWLLGFQGGAFLVPIEAFHDAPYDQGEPRYNLGPPSPPGPDDAEWVQIRYGSEDQQVRGVLLRLDPADPDYRALDTAFVLRLNELSEEKKIRILKIAYQPKVAVYSSGEDPAIEAIGAAGIPYTAFYLGQDDSNSGRYLDVAETDTKLVDKNETGDPDNMCLREEIAGWDVNGDGDLLDEVRLLETPLLCPAGTTGVGGVTMAQPNPSKPEFFLYDVNCDGQLVDANGDPQEHLGIVKQGAPIDGHAGEPPPLTPEEIAMLEALDTEYHTFVVDPTTETADEIYQKIQGNFRGPFDWVHIHHENFAGDNYALEPLVAALDRFVREDSNFLLSVCEGTETLEIGLAHLGSPDWDDEDQSRNYPSGHGGTIRYEKTFIFEDFQIGSSYGGASRWSKAEIDSEESGFGWLLTDYRHPLNQNHAGFGGLQLNEETGEIATEFDATDLLTAGGGSTTTFLHQGDPDFHDHEVIKPHEIAQGGAAEPWEVSDDLSKEVMLLGIQETRTPTVHDASRQVRYVYGTPDIDQDRENGYGHVTYLSGHSLTESTNGAGLEGARLVLNNVLFGAYTALEAAGRVQSWGAIHPDLSVPLGTDPGEFGATDGTLNSYSSIFRLGLQGIPFGVGTQLRTAPGAYQTQTAGAMEFIMEGSSGTRSSVTWDEFQALTPEEREGHPQLITVPIIERIPTPAINPTPGEANDDYLPGGTPEANPSRELSIYALTEGVAASDPTQARDIHVVGMAEFFVIDADNQAPYTQNPDDLENFVAAPWRSGELRGHLVRYLEAPEDGVVYPPDPPLDPR